MVTKSEDRITSIAQRIVYADRGNTYGHPLDDFSRIAKMWGALFGTAITPEQVALAMICVKMSRLQTSPDHRDSVIDIAGYAETYDMVITEGKRRSDNVVSISKDDK